MPGFDRTGPEGQGSRTGRGLGRCNPDSKNDDRSQDDFRPGRGFGWGRGRGRGRGRGFGFGRRNRWGWGRRND